jgi:hypothetical protein
VILLKLARDHLLNVQVKSSNPTPLFADNLQDLVIFLNLAQDHLLHVQLKPSNHQPLFV